MCVGGLRNNYTKNDRLQYLVFALFINANVWRVMNVYKIRNHPYQAATYVITHIQR